MFFLLGSSCVILMASEASPVTDHVNGNFVLRSCEPFRSSSYSNDLRWKMIWQTLGLMLPTKQVAMNLNVDESTVRRTTRLFDTTGTVNKKEYTLLRSHFGKLPNQQSFHPTSSNG